MSKRSNKIEATIGGEVRVFKYAMQASEALTDVMQSDATIANNPFKLTKYLFYHGLNNSENKFENPLTTEQVVDWIDEMDQDEFNKVREFALECLGFMMLANKEVMEGIANSKAVKDMTLEQS